MGQLAEFDEWRKSVGNVSGNDQWSQPPDRSGCVRPVGASEDFLYADLSKIKIDLKDHDISEGNTKGYFDPFLMELKRFA